MIQTIMLTLLYGTNNVETLLACLLLICRNEWLRSTILYFASFIFSAISVVYICIVINYNRLVKMIPFAFPMHWM